MHGLPCWRKVNGYREQIRSVFSLAALQVLILRAFLLVWFYLHTATSFSNTPHPIIRVSLLNYASPFEMRFRCWRENGGIFLEKCDHRDKYKLFHCIFIISVLSWTQPTFFPPIDIPAQSRLLFNLQRIQKLSQNKLQQRLLIQDPLSGWYCCKRCGLGWRGFGGSSGLAGLGAKHRTKIFMFLL